MQHIVITGSTRGIGLCLAAEFLKAGCRVTLSGRGETPPETVRALADAHPDRVRYIPCDVRQAEKLEILWHEAARWGRIDHWINNAGRNAPYEPVADTDPRCADEVLDTNLRGVIHGSRVAVRGMRAQGGGQVWNMEGLGSDNRIQKGTVLYATTKHALTYFSRGLAAELAGTDVRVGRLAPGMMLTDFITKTPEGEASPVIRDPAFRWIFNVLGDRPETVAAYLVPRILANRRQNRRIRWLSTGKVLGRFLMAPFRRGRLLP